MNNTQQFVKRNALRASAERSNSLEDLSRSPRGKQLKGSVNRLVGMTSQTSLGRTSNGARSPGNKTSMIDLDQGLSQADRERIRSQRYTNEVLRRVSVESKQNILQSMRKGQNTNGGVFAGCSPEREPSPNATVSGFMKQSGYNHS